MYKYVNMYDSWNMTASLLLLSHLNVLWFNKELFSVFMSLVNKKIKQILMCPRLNNLEITVKFTGDYGTF